MDNIRVLLYKILRNISKLVTVKNWFKQVLLTWKICRKEGVGRGGGGDTKRWGDFKGLLSLRKLCRISEAVLTAELTAGQTMDNKTRGVRLGEVN